MKMYLAVSSLCLLVGAGLGHVNGKYHAAADFVDDCKSVGIVVFQDHDSDARRHFHCFELDHTKAHQLPVQEQAPPPVPMI